MHTGDNDIDISPVVYHFDSAGKLNVSAYDEHNGARLLNHGTPEYNAALVELVRAIAHLDDGASIIDRALHNRGTVDNHHLDLIAALADAIWAGDPVHATSIARALADALAEHRGG
jgi:hypothetical protein